MSGACARNLEVSDRPLGIYGREGEIADFGRGICETVQRGGLARRGLSDEGNKRISWHGEVVWCRSGLWFGVRSSIEVEVDNEELEKVDLDGFPRVTLSTRATCPVQSIRECASSSRGWWLVAAAQME